MASRREYPKYDWRGIAMLTEQLGQLFQPNQLKLMDSKQKHEMNLLMAKKAWDTETENLKFISDKYDATVKEVAGAEAKLKEYGLGELARASGADGAMGDQASVIFDRLDVKSVMDMQDLASQYRDMLSKQQDKLSHYVTLNENAKMGEGFSKRMTSLPSAKDQKEYDVLAESDGVPGLSYKEKQKALSMYIKDTGLVLNEDHGDYDTGISQQVWNGTKYEDLKVSPEGAAFISGYNSTLAKETIAKQKLSSSTKGQGRPDPSNMTDQYVIKLLEQNNARIEQINNKVTGKTLEEHLAYDKFGDFFAEKSAKEKGWTDLEIADYVASKNGLRDALKEIRKRPGLDIPAEKLGIKHALSYTINESDNPRTAKMFENAKISSDILYAKILMKEGDDRYMDMFSAYEDIMKGDAAFPDDARQAGLNAILDWVNK